MPAPTTVPELLDRVRRSGLIPPERLEGFLVGLGAAGNAPATPAELLDRLVDAGMITRFHADRLAQGKYKGFQLGSYLILEQLGVGGMGQVYLAEHAAMRRLVALKVLPVIAADDPVARERFFREARASAALDHPNIIRVFDLCQEGKIYFLVMEYVEGISLHQLVARRGPLPVATACQYARQVAFALQHAHDLGMVHRDIKPANLLVDRAGVVKVLDLGLVRTEADADAGLTRRLDHQGVLGTADYVAPEQAVDSSGVDIRADLYSLGATFYYLLAGRPLFPEGRTAQKLVWQQIKDPTPITRVRPDVPEELAEVVHRLLKKNPADRFQTPAEVFDALAPWTQDPVPPPAEELLPRPGGRVLLARSGVVSAAATSRAAGTTSHIVMSAMRSGGSGSVPLSGPRQPDAGGTGGQSSSVIARPTPQPRPLDETDATALGETRGGSVARRPEPPPELERTHFIPPRLPGQKWWRSRKVTRAALLLLAAALVGLGLALLAR